MTILTVCDVIKQTASKYLGKGIPKRKKTYLMDLTLTHLMPQSGKPVSQNKQD